MKTTTKKKILTNCIPAYAQDVCVCATVIRRVV